MVGNTKGGVGKTTLALTRLVFACGCSAAAACGDVLDRPLRYRLMSF